MTLERLAASPLFTGLTDEDLNAVLQKGTILTLQAGDSLVNEGQVNDHLHVLLMGQLEVSLPGKEGRFTRIRLGLLSPGDCIGEYSFFDRKPASADVGATSESQLFKIAQSDLSRLVDENPRLGSVLFKNLLVQLIERLRSKDTELDLFSPN